VSEGARWWLKMAAVIVFAAATSWLLAPHAVGASQAAKLGGEDELTMTKETRSGGRNEQPSARKEASLPHLRTSREAY